MRRRRPRRLTGARVEYDPTWGFDEGIHPGCPRGEAALRRGEGKHGGGFHGWAYPQSVRAGVAGESRASKWEGIAIRQRP